MFLFSAGTMSLRNIAIASDTSEYSVQDSSYFTELKTYKIELRKAAANYNAELTKLNQDTLEKKQPLRVSVEDIHNYDKSKLAFLTFDDGPSESVTLEILDTLADYDIKATFFVLGSMCDKNGSVLKEINEEGHSIGIHSYSHKLSELLQSDESFINEIKMTEDALTKHLGENFKTRLFRFPGGSFESNKRQYFDVLNELGYVSVDWNALTGDTEYVNPTPEMLLDRLKATTVNKNNIVVLMHDFENKRVSAKVLPEVIEYLKSEGYEFAVLK
jgi:peptidoglycan/xylan/chitin deacetylase (PgdA/CDA1 family)